MELDRLEDAKVAGKANVFVPSRAGLKLDLGGGLKALVVAAWVSRCAVPSDRLTRIAPNQPMVARCDTHVAARDV